MLIGVATPPALAAQAASQPGPPRAPPKVELRLPLHQARKARKAHKTRRYRLGDATDTRRQLILMAPARLGG